MRNKLIFCLVVLLLVVGCVTLPKPPITAIQSAENFVEQNQTTQAEQTLDKYRHTWKTQAIRGDIAAYRGQWQQAAQFFQESWNLIEKAEPEPIHSEKEKIYSSLEETQLLAGKTVSSLIKPPTNYKGWRVPKVLVPVEFKSGGWRINELTQEGKKAIRDIADYLDANKVREATLTGHTDERGPAKRNQVLSEKRAKSIRQFLVNIGTRTKIKTEGKGEDEPLRPLPRWKRNWTQAEIYQRDRRVELESDIAD